MSLRRRRAEAGFFQSLDRGEDRHRGAEDAEGAEEGKRGGGEEVNGGWRSSFVLSSSPLLFPSSFHFSMYIYIQFCLLSIISYPSLLFPSPLFFPLFYIFIYTFSASWFLLASSCKICHRKEETSKEINRGNIYTDIEYIPACY